MDLSTAVTTADSFLARLGDRGIDYIFANAGTDFASIIESLARNAGGRRKFPKVITVTHENVAMAMAHGYYRVSGKPAVVMVHVTVGTANAVCGLMNSARDNVPIILAAGRTPLTEDGHAASRNRSIHWGQEMFDQGGMVREFVKWDYEARADQPIGALVDRALDIAMSAPRGPVYLALPREVLAEPSVAPRRDTVRTLGATPAAPAAAAIETAAQLIAKAEFPLILNATLGRDPAGMAALGALADAYAIPVLQSEARDVNLASDHAMNIGFDPGTHLAEADVVVVFDSAVPWIPRTNHLKRGAKVIHIGPDPLCTQYPFRDFEADLLVAGDCTLALMMLKDALAAPMKARQTEADARRKTIAGVREEMAEKRAKLIAQVKSQSPVHPAWLAACLNKAKSKDAIISNELGLPLSQLDLTQPRTYLGSSLAGGLGAGLGSALGAKLAAPDRDVIAAVGDGSYFFGNPLSYHYTAKAEGLATLTIVSNNHSWNAVRRATLDVYPSGHAAKANEMPLTMLKELPPFEQVIETCGGRGERVETPDQLPGALERSFEAIRSGTPALLNVMMQNRM